MVADYMFYVPWPDSTEWNTVREQIFSSDVQDTISAYQTILMWKLKYDSVPTYIECTYCLLQVMVKEYEMTKNEQNSLVFNEHDLRLSYSTALIRFVNHVSSVSSYKGETLYLAAKSQNIPDWIINMRHDVAHGQELPSLEALHIAAELSLKWLLDNYWKNSEPYEQKLMDETQFDIDAADLREVDTDTQNFFKKFFDIWVLCSNKKYDKIQCITEVDREFMLLCEEMLSLSSVYFNNSKHETTIKIQNIVNAYSQMEETGEFASSYLYSVIDFKMLLLKFVKMTVKEDDLLKDSLLLSLFQTSFLMDTNFKIIKWEKILWLLQELDLFSSLLQILFQLAGKGHKTASKWLSTLLPALRHLKRQWAIFKVLTKEQKHYKSKLIKKKIKLNCKPKKYDLVISLDIYKPPVITLEMVKNILLNPEHFSVKNIVEYLKLVKPPLMKFTLDMIKDLVSLHKAGNIQEQIEDVDNVDNDKVFTVDDLEKVMETEQNLVVEEASNESTGWTKSSIDVNEWNKCPLGLLPFQTKVDCNLPESLSWEKKPSTRKRVSIPLLKHSVRMKKFREI